MSSSPAWLTIALRELGVREAPGVADNPRVLEYHAATTLAATDDAVPWCAAFASWAIERAGRRSPRTASARQFLLWGGVLDEPREGCVTVLSRGDSATTGHVGFAVAWDAQLIWCVGGNQGDAVTVAPFARPRVLGWRWPVEDA